MFKRLPSFLTINALRAPLIKLGIVGLLAIVFVSLADSLTTLRSYQGVMNQSQKILKGDMLVQPQYSGFPEQVPLQTKTAVTTISDELKATPYFFKRSTSLMADSMQSQLKGANLEVQINGEGFHDVTGVELNAATIKRTALTTNKKIITAFTKAASEELAVNPLLLGANYRQKYQVGDQVTLYDFEDFRQENDKILAEPIKNQFQVIGFMEKGASLTDLTDLSGERLPLDDQIIVPLILKRQLMDDPVVSDLGDYFFLLSQKQAETTSPLVANRKLQNPVAKSGYLNFGLQNLNENVDFSLSDLQQKYQENYLRTGLFILLVLLQFMVLFSLIASKERGTYQLFYMLGSTKAELFAMSQIFYLGLGIATLAITYLANLYYLKNEWSLDIWLIASCSIVLGLLGRAAVSVANLLRKLGAEK